MAQQHVNKSQHSIAVDNTYENSLSLTESNNTKTYIQRIPEQAKEERFVLNLSL